MSITGARSDCISMYCDFVLALQNVVLITVYITFGLITVKLISS